MLSAVIYAVAVAFILVRPLMGQTRRALLIGIDHYNPDQPPAMPPVPPQGQPKDSRFAEFPPDWEDLQGPSNDVQRMKALLENHYGFKDADIEVLTEQEATRKGILDAIQNFLVVPSRAGDLEVFYFSGHGSQRLNSKSTKCDNVAGQPRCYDETIVPADAWKGAYDIRDKELAKSFDQILAKQAKLVAIFDSCHSGTMARGLVRVRDLPPDDRDVAHDPTAYQGDDLSTVPAKGNAIILSAALSTEEAQEQYFDDVEAQEGDFTHALVNLLSQASASLRASDVIEAVQNTLHWAGDRQQPTAEGRATDSLFGEPVAAPALRAAVTSMDSEILHLDIGSLSGLGVGTQFTSLQPGDGGLPVVIQLASVDSPMSSSAQVVAGGGTFHGGELFEVSRRVSASNDQLHIYVPDAAGAGTLAVASAQARFPGLHWLNDPALGAYALVAPGAKGWQEIAPPAAGAHAPTAFLAMPFAARFTDALRKDPYFNPKDGSGVLTDDVAGADYLLLSRGKPGAAGVMQVALVSPSAFGTPPRNGFVMNQDRQHPDLGVCGNTNSSPIRTPWIDIQDGSSDAATAAIDLAAEKITMLRRWMRLAGASAPPDAWPYRPTVMVDGSAGTRHALGASEVLSSGTAYQLDLVANPQALASGGVEPMYVYLVGFDCAGDGTILYPDPNENGVARLPTVVGGEQPAEDIPLPVNTDDHKHVYVAEPFGADSIFMLVTNDKIDNPEAVLLGHARGNAPTGAVEAIVIPSRAH